jgi:hypothetical protein
VFGPLIIVGLGHTDTISIGFTQRVLEVRTQSRITSTTLECDTLHWYSIVLSFDISGPGSTLLEVSVNGHDFVRFNCGWRRARPSSVNGAVARTPEGAGMMVGVSIIHFSECNRHSILILMRPPMRCPQWFYSVSDPEALSRTDQFKELPRT